jgi:hypothetical protein
VTIDLTGEAIKVDAGDRMDPRVEDPGDVAVTAISR